MCIPTYRKRLTAAPSTARAESPHFESTRAPCVHIDVPSASPRFMLWDPPPARAPSSPRTINSRDGAHRFGDLQGRRRDSRHVRGHSRPWKRWRGRGPGRPPSRAPRVRRSQVPPPLSCGTSPRSPRFAQEARTGIRIKNEHVARVYDVGTVVHQPGGRAGKESHDGDSDSSLLH